MKKVLSTLTVLLIIFGFAYAQQDSLVFRNGEYLVGEVKKMDKNVVTVETPYSDKDFNIKWNRIQEIYTNTYFLITLTNGNRYNGTISSNAPGRISIITDEGDSVGVNHSDIVYLDDLDKGFWSQLSFSIDLGFEMTRSNNFMKFTTNTGWGIPLNDGVLTHTIIHCFPGRMKPLTLIELKQGSVIDIFSQRTGIH